MTVLVTGARGNVGRAVLDALVTAGQDVRAASRDVTTLDVGVAKVSADLEDPSTLDAALEGVSSVFLYTRPQGIEGFVKAAEAAGVRHVVLLSSGATLEPRSAQSRVARLHRAVEEALIAAPFAETLLNPGSFATNTLGWRADIAEGVVRTPYPDSRVGAIHERDIGDVAAKILADGSHAGEALQLSGPEPISFREQAAILADVLGRPLRVEELTPEQAAGRMAALGWPPEVPPEILRAMERTTREASVVTDVVRDVTGHAPRTFRQWAEDHRADFS
ncbi:nucleoside-diphosphate sugar epimerase [Amycolatopsis balhimycina DSM 5908]|uniref:Nucleoside-diphosphate sugar epimerase n=1 Tax=Amycolatopsis balhimycina DSM 5908 TaxID=1081091 RepID=A0A428WGR5_AMYBA|nr:NAD(P)H-binding protein [Amycolatopsis balhimycina]RSM42274.1 nucleoside-diphosphate sugar epimerase [Amycolatopsis balhimycina DSM 5908]